MPHKPEDFVGAWCLIDWRIEYENGGVTRPFGQDASGYIVYAASGIMTASIARQNRPSFGIANARNADPAQKAAAFDSYFHYAGSWYIEGEHIVHDVTLSLNPDMVQSEQRRLAVWEGDGTLSLSAKEPLSDGTVRHHILQWTSH